MKSRWARRAFMQTAGAVGCALLGNRCASAGETSTLQKISSHFDKLIENGLDRYGKEQTAMSMAKGNKARAEAKRRPGAQKLPSPPRVLLLVETSTTYGRDVLDGIGRYVREHGPWSLFFEQRALEQPPSRWVKRWRGDGIIARTATQPVADLIEAAGVPTVELLGQRANEPAQVCSDTVATGRMAAEHLLGCGLRNLGFFAVGEAWWIAGLREGMQEPLRLRGLACDVYQPPRANRRLDPKWQDSQEAGVAAWLRALPKPAGVFAPTLFFAARLLDICRSVGLTVPEQVAVITAPDDPLLCNVTTPPLTTVDQACARVGYEAAALLDRMMQGAPPPEETLWIPPNGVVTRQSTDMLAIDDAEVAQALRLIREHACQELDVSYLSEACCLSRRTLERKFQQYLGRGPKAEILRVRIERAKFLLAQAEMSVEAVAHRSGFPSLKNFARSFLREVGTTPRAFRRSHRVVRDM